MPDTVWMSRNQRLDIPKTQERTRQAGLEKKKVNEMLPNGILLYSWISASPVILREASSSI